MKHTAITTLAVAVMASGSALATGGKWDSATAGFAGTGVNGANPWIATLPFDSSYAEWNFFDGYPTDSSPDIRGAGSVTENSGGAFITGGGNVYSPGAVTDFTVTLAGKSATREVFLRIATLGSLPDTIATLNGVQATAVETFTANVGGVFGGTEKEWYWTWVAAPAANYVFNFRSSSSSMSLDQLAVYAVPEPSAYALMGLGLVGAAAVARRRKPS